MKIPLDDLGFKVFKSAKSNYKHWKASDQENLDSVGQLFEDHIAPPVLGWKKEDLLSETLLLEGFPLTSKITYLEDYLRNEVYHVSAVDFCATTSLCVLMKRSNLTRLSS